MQRRLSAFKDYTIEAPDGNVGHISDILFEDDNWNLRWFVVNTGSWLFGRRLLLHPTTLGKPDIRQGAFPVMRTRAEIEASPDLSSDLPVSGQMKQNLDVNYAYGSIWDDGFYNSYNFGLSNGGMSTTSSSRQDGMMQAGDPRLRSINQVFGYSIHALDGDIGHLDDFLVDDETWKIEYAVVDTKNWGSGKHVLVPATEIKSFDWGERDVRIDRTRYSIKSAPSWQEPDWSDHHAG